MPPVILIAGPTASGKSALAVALAKRYSGEVINADSMQVYSDLQIISARPLKTEMADIPHHLYGHIDGTVRYSTGAWLREAVPLMLEIMARGKVPILVGGTGLYFQSLIRGLANIPDVPSEVFEAEKNQLKQDGFEARYDYATQIDPVASARLQGRDPQRLIRILSVYKASGTPLSDWQAHTKPIIPFGFWRGFILQPDRAALYERINQRFAKMIKQGGGKEVESLLARGLHPSLPVMKAIGISQAVRAKGEWGSPDWIALCQRDTRRFAKRQGTFFRSFGEEWTRLVPQSGKPQDWMADYRAITELILGDLDGALNV